MSHILMNGKLHDMVEMAIPVMGVPYWRLGRHAMTTLWVPILPKV
jgi:hypothetical protein